MAGYMIIAIKSQTIESSGKPVCCGLLHFCLDYENRFAEYEYDF